jgi:hypothetical protein
MQKQKRVDGRWKFDEKETRNRKMMMMVTTTKGDAVAAGL